MLAATRDPMRPGGTQAPPVSHDNHRLHEAPAAASAAAPTARMLGLLQLTGAFLAIPVALGSAYSVYRVNFAPDTQCQQLRAGIIAMIDKQIDAGTRRMLVRRDVESFEKFCGAFDPDAKAAFVSLLAEPRPVAVKAKAEPAKPAPVKAEVQKAEAPKAEPKSEPKAEPKSEHKREAKAEPKLEPKVEPKLEPKIEAKFESKPEPKPAAKAAPAEADVATADARWLDAVRGALVAHAPEAAPVLTAQKTAHPSPMPLPSWVAEEPVAPRRAPVAAAPESAPALPAATVIGEPQPAVVANDPDRPVPPAAIPDAPANGGARTTWVSKIPFVGQVLDK